MVWSSLGQDVILSYCFPLLLRRMKLFRSVTVMRGIRSSNPSKTLLERQRSHFSYNIRQLIAWYDSMIQNMVKLYFHPKLFRLY